MSVRIRLRRIGRKKQPSYRMVVADSATPRDGAYVEAVGFYNPRMQPAELRVDLERVEAWLGRGADMSDTVASLVRIARRGGDEKVGLKPVGGEPRPAPEPIGSGDVAPAPSAGAAATTVPAAGAAAEPTARTAESEPAAAEPSDASAEPRREAAAAPAEPGAAEAGRGPAETEPPE